MLDLGPFPRRPLRYPLTPQRVFIQGIPGMPGAEGIPWLQADAEVTAAFALGDAFPMPAAVTGLCESPLEAGFVSRFPGTFSTYTVSVELQCPVRVSKDRRQEWWGQARSEVLDAALDAAVTDNLNSGGTTSWDGTLTSAVGYLNYQYGSAGMIGLPPQGFQEFADYLRYEDDGVFTNTGHRVWLRRVRAGSETEIIYTSDVFYESHIDEYAANVQDANVDVRRITAYVKAVFDLPGVLAVTSES